MDEAHEISCVVYKGGVFNEEVKCFPVHWKGCSEGRVLVVAIRDIDEVELVYDVEEEEEEDISEF